MDWVGFALATKITTPLSSFASVDAALGLFNDLNLDAANNFIPRVISAFHGGIPSVLPSL